MSRRCSRRGSVDRDGQHLVVAALLVGHAEHADRAAAHQHAGEQRVAVDEHERVQRVAVLAEGVLDEAVVGRVLRRGEQRAVEPHAPGLVIDLVLVPAPAGDLDEDVELHGSGSSYGGVGSTASGDMRRRISCLIMTGPARVPPGSPPSWSSSRWCVGAAAATCITRVRTAPPDPAPRAASALPAWPAPADRSTDVRPSAAGAAADPAGVGPGCSARLLVVEASGRGCGPGCVTPPRGRRCSTAAGQSRPHPASTAKLLTAAAVLTVHRPTDRFTTAVLAGSGPAAGTVYLRGGGDPTLTAAAPGHAGAYPGAARLTDLAAAVRRAGVPVRRIVVDDGRCSPGRRSRRPGWPRTCPATTAPASPPSWWTAGGPRPATPSAAPRPTSRPGPRSRQRSAGRPYPVTRGQVPAAGARVLGQVASAPVSTLVTQMLLESDNVIAEILARQVALAQHRPATFLGGAAAVRAVVRGLGVDPGAGMVDGSGLAARDRISPAVLATVLRTVSQSSASAARGLASSLPVAGWSGSLADRYVSGSTSAAAGDVRAKTGTLTGVSALAGLVHDRSGRLLAFAFIADRNTSTQDAEAGLDAAATALASCGCR